MLESCNYGNSKPLVYRKNDNYVDLSNLPRKDTSNRVLIDWEKCYNEKVNFKFKDVEDTLLLSFKVKNNSRQILVTLKYNDKELDIHTSNLKKVKLTNLLYNYKTFKYDIGEELKGMVILDRYRDKGKRYKVKCLTYDEEFDIKETDLKNLKASPYVNNNSGKVTEKSSLYSVIELRPYIKNLDEAKKINKFSRKTILCECPICGKQKKEKSCNLLRNVTRGVVTYYCPYCSTNTSYAEKLMIALLEENNISYEHQKMFNFSHNRVYDFYLPQYNLVIETHGEQHYKVSSSSKWKLYSEIDREKKQYLTDNEVDLVVIDCSKSNFEFIINNIKNSKLNSIFSIYNYDDILNRVKELSNYQDIKDIIKDYQNGKKVKDITDEYGISKKTMYALLHKYHINTRSE